jgi:hypothetical protein
MKFLQNVVQPQAKVALVDFTVEFIDAAQAELAQCKKTVGTVA